MTSVPAVDYLHLIKVELARLGGVAPENLGTPLPHIEGWTVQAVVAHTGWICRYVSLCLEAPATQPPRRSDIAEPPAGPDVLEWFDEGRRLVISSLESSDPTQVRPTWTGPQPGEWWIRRLAQESSMHRWDAYAATESPDPIDAHLALDGIDEVFDVFAPHRLQFATLNGSGQKIHLHATDVEAGEWTVTLEPKGLTWERAHEKGDVAARGPVSDLLLMLWSRIPPSRLEVFGDAALLDRWQQAAKF